MVSPDKSGLVVAANRLPVAWNDQTEHDVFDWAEDCMGAIERAAPKAAR